jgi:hypothetical protein
MAGAGPLGVGNDNNDADDDALYGGAGNDAVYGSTRDGLDMIVRYGIPTPTLVSYDRTTTFSSRKSAGTRP